MLMLAAKYGKADIVQYLLSKGADPTIKDGLGKLAIDYAKDGNFYKIIDMLLDPNAKSEREARERERKEKEKQKEEQRAKERLSNEKIANEDMLNAIQDGKLYLVKQILSEGFNINKKFVKNYF